MSEALPIRRAVQAARVQLVSDQDYLGAVERLVHGARERVLCSIFIVDLSPAESGRLVVDDLLLALAEARWRGADVRLLVGGTRDNIALAEAADAARARGLALGLPCRWLTSRGVRGSHCKIVLADDRVLTGSHNWSPGALLGETQTQDSVCVQSAALAALVAQRFERQWARAEDRDAAL